jgi:hypothetical protein
MMRERALSQTTFVATKAQRFSDFDRAAEGIRTYDPSLGSCPVLRKLATGSILWLQGRIPDRSWRLWRPSPTTFGTAFVARRYESEALA